MKNSFRVGSVFGISIFVHFTWFFVFALVTLSLVDRFSGTYPKLSPVTHWMIGVITSLLFFISVLIHEMAHSLLARKLGQKVRAITLLIFGGISEIEGNPTEPKTEIWVALVGPLSSLGLGAVFGGVWYLTRNTFPVMGGVSGWLAIINIFLGGFNLLPGLPLDGGRVLHGLAWQSTGSLQRATQIAADVGQGIGYVMIMLAVWQALLTGNFVGGLWLGFIGWFLVNAAQASLLQLVMQGAFEHIHAFQVMKTDCPFVPGSTSIQDFVDSYLLRSGNRCYFVGDQDNPRGLITLEDVRSVSRQDWEFTSVQAAMRPMAQLQAVAPETPIGEVLRILDSSNIAQVVVVQGTTLLGLIGREQVLRLIRNRLDLAA